MDRDELSLNAWIFIGNVLNKSLQETELRRADEDRADHDRLQTLGQVLVPVQPSSMLDALAQLAARDRQLLLTCARRSLIEGGADLEIAFGLDATAATEVLGYLEAADAYSGASRKPAPQRDRPPE